MMAEGRCCLTNYVTGVSTNMDGVCSPAADVHYEEDADAQSDDAARRLRHRPLCRRRKRRLSDHLQGPLSVRRARRRPYYAFEEPVSLNLSALLPDLMRAGVTALKIEGRQRSRAYVKSVVAAFRKAVDDIMAGREAGFRRA